MDELEGKLAEYESLRNEISQNDALIQKVNIFGFWAVVLPLLFFAYHRDNEVLILPPVAYFVYLQMVVHKLEGTFRIAGYLATFLEPQIPGMGWESRLALLRGKSSTLPGVPTHTALLIVAVVGTLVPSVTASSAPHAFISGAAAVAVLLWSIAQIRALNELSGPNGFAKSWKELREKESRAQSAQQP